jgi:hypothetical protein
MPVRVLMRVDLPEPFGPTIEVILPASKEMESLFTARTPSKCFERSLVARRGMQKVYTF